MSTRTGSLASAKYQSLGSTSGAARRASGAERLSSTHEKVDGPSVDYERDKAAARSSHNIRVSAGPSIIAARDIHSIAARLAFVAIFDPAAKNLNLCQRHGHRTRWT